MLLLKLFLELFALVLLFFLVNTDRLIGKAATESLRPAFNGSYQRGKTLYSVLFYGTSIVLSVTLFWTVYGAFNVLHGLGSYSSILVVSQLSLIIPVVTLGFCGGVVFTPWLCTHLFGMSEVYITDEERGKKVFAILPACLGCLLICFQFNTYMKTDGERIITKKFGEDEKVYSISQVERIISGESSSFQIYLDNGDRISVGDYSGNVNYFLDNIPQ